MSAELDAFRGLGTATLATSMAERGYPLQFVAGLSSHGGRTSFVGYASTMRMVPGRTDLCDAPGVDRFRWALDEVPEDHVVVVDCMGDVRVACFGEILVQRLVARRAAAVVTDGSIRDSAQIGRMDIAVRAGAVNASTRGSVLCLAGTQETIACGGVAVAPGDVLVGDEDGVLVVPRVIAADLPAAARSRASLEEYAALRISQGAALRGTYPPDESTLRDYDAWTATRRPSADGVSSQP